MKKKLHVTLFSLLALSQAFSQEVQPIEGTEIAPEIVEQLNREALMRRVGQSDNREAINGWVSFELTEYNYVHTPDAFFTYGQVVSPDSLARVSFSGGVFRSYVHGFGQIFDPTAEDMDIANIRLTELDAYTVDSIGFPSIYRRVNHNDIDDTLVLTVAITNKETSTGNPYDGSFWWNETGLVLEDVFVMSPSYAGSPADGYHHGLTGITDAANDVEIQQYKFALTAADTNVFWRAFPVDISADPDQVIYTFVEFKPSFEATIEDTAFVFDGAVGVATTNSFRTIYDYPVSEDVGYFFDLYREDEYSYNASYVVDATTRYAEHSGDDDWRNNRLNSYSLWGFRFEYYMNAVSSVGIDEEENIAQFSVYPNPVQDQMIFKPNATLGGENGRLEIMDIDGRVLLQIDWNGVNSLTIDCEQLGLAKGIYVVSLTTVENRYSQKFVLE